MARKKTHRVKPVVVNKENMRLELGTERLNRNLNDAQFALDSAIMTSMQPFMPMDTGQFINRVKDKNSSLAGTGEVYAAVGPEGRFLYEGKVMIGERSRSVWAKKGERKVVTMQPLRFSKSANPRATDHWFEKSRDVDENQWKRVVKKEMSKP